MSTRNGPEYGGCSGFRTASHLINTWEQLERLLLTYVRRCSGCLVGVAESCLIACLRRSTYGVSETAGCTLDVCTKKSPGRRRVVPYASSAAVHLMSAL